MPRREATENPLLNNYFITNNNETYTFHIDCLISFNVYTPPNSNPSFYEYLALLSSILRISSRTIQTIALYTHHTSLFYLYIFQPYILNLQIISNFLKIMIFYYLTSTLQKKKKKKKISIKPFFLQTNKHLTQCSQRRQNLCLTVFSLSLHANTCTRQVSTSVHPHHWLQGVTLRGFIIPIDGYTLTLFHHSSHVF